MQRVNQAPKASGGDLPTGPLQDWLPEPERGRDWVPRTQPIPGGSSSILLIPRWFLEQLCAHPLPNGRHCSPIWCLSAPPSQGDKAPPGLEPGQKSGGGQHGAHCGPRRPRRGRRACVHSRDALLEQRPSCPTVTGQKERVPGHPHLGPRPQAQSPGGTAGPPPSSQERVKRKAQ